MKHNEQVVCCFCASLLPATAMFAMQPSHWHTDDVFFTWSGSCSCFGIYRIIKLGIAWHGRAVRISALSACALQVVNFYEMTLSSLSADA